MNNTEKTKKFDDGFLERVIAYMAGNVYWLDRNCVYLGCNDNAAKFMGLNSRKDVVGKTYENIGKIAKWTAEHTASWKRDTLEVISTGEPKLNIENKPILLPDGREVFYLSNLVPLFDDKKNVVGVIGTSVDITDHKKIEKLQTEKEVAERTSKFMQRLAGSIAHEIRTPLAIISINADLLERIQCVNVKHTDDGAREKYFKAIKHTIKSASRIIDNILTTIRALSSEKITKDDFQYLSIADTVESVLEMYPFLPHEKLLVYFEKTKDFTYYGNKILTQHMLFNLVKNALLSIKEAGKGKIKIQLEKGKTNNKLIFADTSLGITEKETKKAGTGLGLAFCKMVMRSYGGDISCISKPEKHTEFTLSFPSKTKDPN
ncbi:MAG: ATP-binding protein [bacterium]